MRNIFFFLFILNAFAAIPSYAQTSRALIIGINLYKPPAEKAITASRSQWRNLTGCVNDAEAMRHMIMAKYGFSQQNITTLFDQEAARERIISELNKLIETSSKGDVVFIYYAGHGSQMKNSLSLEDDKKDETIVPADSYKGAADIRDKELAKYFNLLLDKGVLLTIVFDSCHSGSVGRGNLFEITSTRYLEGSPVDAKDPSDPQKPEERGALIISAAQDFEFAKELKDENNVPHGAFTLALLKALQQNAADASVENIFSSLRAIMKFYGKTQEPVLAGNASRKMGTLFGLPKGKFSNKLTIATSKMEGDKMELLGGYALGLSEGVRLKNINSDDTIVITEMRGANRSMAKTVNDSKNKIKPGELFEVISWSSSIAPALKIYIPEAASNDVLAEALTTISGLQKTKKVKHITDLTKEPAQIIFNYDQDQWWAVSAGGGKKIIGNKLPPASSKEYAVTSAFFNVPPSHDLFQALKFKFDQSNNIEIVTSAEESQYALIGTLDEMGNLVYSFIKTNYSLEDSADVLPARTNFEILKDPKRVNAVTTNLAENVFRIAKIKDWLMLQPPPGVDKFPFELNVQYYNSNKSSALESVSIGDTLSLFLTKKEGEVSWNRRKRYVYVFSIDAEGSMSLLYPNASRGNIENRLPVTTEQNHPLEKMHLVDILIQPPAGHDTYFLLTTEEAISNLSAFQQPGVLSRGNMAAAKTPLDALLFTGAKTRNKITTPLTWSIEKITIKSIDQKKK